MPNLCIDIGNTRVKYVVFDAEDALIFDAITDDLEPDFVAQICAKYSVEKSMLASVRDFDAVQLLLAENKNNKTKVAFAEFLHDTPLPIVNQYETPKTVGLDRLAVAVAAAQLFPQENCLIIDAGTCITFDLIDRVKIYHGGSIHPGIWMRTKAMHTFTKRLPLIEMDFAAPWLGKNTHACLNAGAVSGTIAEINGMIELYQAHFENLKIIMTGGDGSFLANSSKKQIFARQFFVLEGLNQILKWNA